MPTITLKEGDFGAEVPATVDLTALYLPDPVRPGAVVIVPLAEVAEIEALRDDHSGRLKAAAKLSARGFMAAGPVGLAAGLLGAGRTKNVIFSVSLKDGRQFVAAATAEIYADLHAAQIGAAAEASRAGEPDDLIAKYLAASFGEPLPAADAEAPPPAPAVAPQPARSPLAGTPRPVFGRRPG